MKEKQAIKLLNDEHDRTDGEAFRAGFGTLEVNMTAAAEWLMDEHGVSEDYAYEYAFHWEVQLPEKYRVVMP